MYPLIKKDFILHKKAILVFLLMVILYFPFMLATANGRGILSISFLYTTMLPLIIFIREDKFSGNALFCSLPFTRKKIVLGTYISAWVFFITGIIFCISTAVILNILFFGNDPEFWYGISPDGILSGFLFLSLIILIWFPLNFKFGIGKGAIVALLLLGMLGFMAGSLLTIITPDLNPVFIIKNIIHWTRNSMEYLQKTVGQMGLYSVLLFLTIVTNFLSFKLSFWIFSRKDL